ncbi:MAG: MotA/TolQ/ExbB proton channel family protein [Kiritimatiellae bacterium]|nr:MotA/TolQ/ExbB proton channel family protein [Kiritimatiellia bacterium]
MKLPFAPIALFLASAGAAAAQEAAPPAAAAPASPTFADLFAAGGLLMWPLLALSVFALAYVAYLFFVLREGAVAPRALVNDVFDAIRTGSPEEARRACDYHRCPFSHVAMAAIDGVSNLPGIDPATLTGLAEGEGARQASRLQRSAQWLLDVASIAPMVGLLGTVLGMFRAFQGIGGDILVSAKPVVLAQGVSLALITTVAGLLVAIPCMCFYAWFRRLAERRVAELECLSADLVTLLLSRRPRA